MNGPAPGLRDLARRLIAYETSARADAADPAGAMEATCERLYVQLERLITAEGFHVLLRRAVYMARAEFAWLEAVRVEGGPGCSLTGVREVAGARDVHELGEAFVTIIANVLWLLVVFIGEDLTLRMVLQAWPELRDASLTEGRTG